MTPVEELHAAAAKLRETAEKATPGPWGVGNGEVIGLGIEQTGRGSFSYTAQLARVIEDEQREEENHGGHDLGSTEADAAWIALASPLLAEPLAASLDAMADEIHRLGGNPRTDADLAKYARMVPTWMPALATARVILRGAS